MLSPRPLPMCHIEKPGPVTKARYRLKVRTVGDILGPDTVVKQNLNFARNSKQKNISSPPLGYDPLPGSSEKTAEPAPRYKLLETEITKRNPCHRRRTLKIRRDKELNSLHAAGKHWKPGGARLLGTRGWKQSLLRDGIKDSDPIRRRLTTKRFSPRREPANRHRRCQTFSPGASSLLEPCGICSGFPHLRGPSICHSLRPVIINPDKRERE